MQVSNLTPTTHSPHPNPFHHPAPYVPWDLFIGFPRQLQNTGDKLHYQHTHLQGATPVTSFGARAWVTFHGATSLLIHCLNRMAR